MFRPACTRPVVAQRLAKYEPASVVAFMSPDPHLKLFHVRLPYVPVICVDEVNLPVTEVERPDADILNAKVLF